MGTADGTFYEFRGLADNNIKEYSVDKGFSRRVDEVQSSRFKIQAVSVILSLSEESDNVSKTIVKHTFTDASLVSMNDRDGMNREAKLLLSSILLFDCQKIEKYHLSSSLIRRME